MNFEYYYWFLKRFFLKHKYRIIIGFFVFISLVYFIFFREIRDITFQISEVQIHDTQVKSDLSYDVYMRSKSKIFNVDITYSFDFEILGNPKYKKDYENYLKNFSLDTSYSCGERKYCEFVSQKDISDTLLSLTDSLYSFGKISKEILNANIQSIDGPSAGNEDIGIGGGLSQGTKIPNPAIDNISENIDCHLSDNFHDPKCYKTPPLNVKIKGLNLDFTLVFEGNEKETIHYYKPLSSSYIKIKGD